MFPTAESVLLTYEQNADHYLGRCGKVVVNVSLIVLIFFAQVSAPFRHRSRHSQLCASGLSVPFSTLAREGFNGIRPMPEAWLYACQNVSIHMSMHMPCGR